MKEIFLIGILLVGLVAGCGEPYDFQSEEEELCYNLAHSTFTGHTYDFRWNYYINPQTNESTCRLLMPSGPFSSAHWERLW